MAVYHIFSARSLNLEIVASSLQLMTMNSNY